LHKDYYRLQSFFANTRIDDGVVLDPPAKQAEYEQEWSKWATATKAIRGEMETLMEPRRVAFAKEHLERFPEDIQAVLTKKAEARSAYDWQIYHKAQPQLVTSDSALEGGLKGEAKTRYLALKAELKNFDHLKPTPLNVAQTMADASPLAPKTFVLRGGAWDAPMEEVQPGFLSILDPKPAQVVPTEKSTGRRTALANWLASESNPLSTRVMVNRVWHYHFGRGLVGTPSDFGVMGERPSHRELLDWLTAKFVGEDQWSLKKLHRRIVLSATYQQSSLHREDAAAVDPENKLLWHFQRRRLEGEAVRDSMLSVAGLLNTKMGGPGVFPPLPEGATVKGYALWKTTPEAADANRRSVYVFVRRNLRYPMFQSFDMPDTHESCARRQETVTPDQALELLNGRLIQEWAAAFAQRVANDQGLDTRAKAERALKIAFQRPATAKEVDMASQFLARQEKTAGSPAAALEDLCHTLLSSNEFLYIQ
jgi:hypothetical protein